MTIRLATNEDIPRIVEMGAVLTAQSSYVGIVDYDKDSAAQTVSEFIESDAAVVLVCEPDGMVVGVVAALVFPLYLNRAHMTAQELWMWIDPEYRGHGGRNLMKALESTVSDMGAKSLCVTAQASIRPEATGRLYRRHGFKLTDLTYMKRI